MDLYNIVFGGISGKNKMIPQAAIDRRNSLLRKFTNSLKENAGALKRPFPGNADSAGGAHATAEHIKGVFCVLLAICIWAGWVVVSRFGVKGTLSPYDITAIRFTTAGLLLLPVIFRKGLRIGPWGLRSAFLLSVLIGACYTIVVITGMKFAPVSHAGTVNTGIFLTLITVVGIHGLREHVSKLRLTGVAFSLAGIALMLAAKSTASSDSQWIGHLCFMAGGALWATYVLLARAWKVDATHAAAVVCVFSMITYMPLYLLLCDNHILSAGWNGLLLQLVYQGILTSIVALIAFNIGVSLLGAARAGAFVPLIPALSTLLAIPALGEIPSFIETLGISAVSVGVFLASGAIAWKRHKHKDSSAHS